MDLDRILRSVVSVNIPSIVCTLSEHLEAPTIITLPEGMNMKNTILSFQLITLLDAALNH